MAHERFEYAYEVHAPVDQVFAYFADPERYAHLSPIISDVRNVQHGVTAQGQPFFEYDSTEALRFARLIPYNNPIHAKVTLTEVNHQIVAHINTRFGVNLEFVFDMDAEDGGTRIRETIDFHMPLLVQNYVVSQAKQVQQARIRIFKAKMEGAVAS
jgi:ligand-binding SRPBCC domain-containing protein